MPSKPKYTPLDQGKENEVAKEDVSKKPTTTTVVIPQSSTSGSKGSKKQMSGDSTDIVPTSPKTNLSRQKSLGSLSDSDHGKGSGWDLSSGTQSDAGNPHLPLLGSQVEDPAHKVCWKRFRGIVAMLCATILTALNPQILYYIEDRLELKYSHSLFVFWFYMIYAVINVIPLLFFTYFDYEGVIDPLVENKKLIIILCFRGCCGGLILFISWHAIDNLGRPAPVSVINAMAPIMVYFIAFFVLHEACGVVPIINAFIACGGVLVMNIDKLLSSKKNESAASKIESQHTWIGTALALTSMCLISWVTVLVRLLKPVHPFMINLSFGVFGLLIMGTVTAFTGTFSVFREFEALGLCACMAVGTTISNLFFTYALKHEQAGVIGIVRTSEVIFNFGYQYLFFGLEPAMFTAIGAAMILFGVFCVAIRKVVLESSEDSKIRKYLFFLKY